MRKIIYFLTFVFLFFVGSDVFALTACDSSELTSLKELAKNVQFKTNYKISTNSEKIDNEVYDSISLIYSIDIINFSKDLKISYDDEGSEELLYYRTNKIEDLAEGSKIKFNIYSYTADYCTNKLLRTVTVDLPIYNDYYYFNKEKCEAAPNFKYCKEFLDTSDLSEEEFNKLYDEYTKPTEVKKEEKKDKTTIYIIAGSALFLVVIAIITIIVVKKRRKSDDL